MSTKQSDSDAIDRIGYAKIREHFEITSSAVSMWKKRGIPNGMRRPLALLGRALGHKMPELPPVDFPNVG